MRLNRLRLLRIIAIGGVALGWLALSASAPATQRGVYIPHPQEPRVSGQLTVQFSDNIPEDRWQGILGAHGASLERPMLVEGFAVAAVPDEKRAEIGQALAGSGVVRTVEDVIYRYPAATPNDPLWSDQWNLRLISADNAWDTTAGEGAVVAVVDTGVAYENNGVFKAAPDLAGLTIVDPYDFYNDDEKPNDDNGHGTHVAGTIAQTTNNAYGLAGIAHRATIMPVKVCGPVPANPRAAQCSTTAIADGVRWAAEHGADVINLSLSDPANVTQVERDALEFARSTGAVLIAAAGNGGSDQTGDGDPVLGYPAAVSIVIAVSASGFFGTLAYYSNYGVGESNTNVDVIAPGGNPPFDNGSIPNEGPTSVITQESYRFFCDPGWPIDFQTFAFCPFAGTSMAAAHVSGVAALIRSAYPNLNGTQVRNLLRCSAVDVEEPGIDLKSGHGLVQADDAVSDSDGDSLPDCIDSEPFTPSPSPSPTVTPLPPPNECIQTPTPSPTTPSPTMTPTATATATAAETATAPPTGTATATGTGSPTATVTATATGSPTPAGPAGVPTGTATATVTATATGANTPTQTPPGSATPGEDPKETATPTATATPSPTQPWIVCGDVDCNTVVDGRDAGGILRFMAFIEPSAECISKGWVNCDGVLDPMDALVILRYTAGLPLGIPPDCPGIG